MFFKKEKKEEPQFDNPYDKFLHQDYQEKLKKEKISFGLKTLKKLF